MIRESFLGGPTEQICRYVWPITALGDCEIIFGVCEASGLVMQTTTVPRASMLEHYTDTATYINPNLKGNPMPAKVPDLD